MTTTALVDGDVFLYRACERAEKAFEWEEDLWSIVADAREAAQHMASDLNAISNAVGADTITIAFSCNGPTFRHEMWPTYKANRTRRKPLCFRALRDRACDRWEESGARRLPKLEADDVLGILATNGSIPGRAVIVTIDKDLRGIPGLHYNPDKDEGIVEVTPAEAERWHLIQSIAGDPTDGYGGVPGLGPVKAARMLDEKGCNWATVVKAYESKGLTEHDALLNARLAKILTADDWDDQAQRVIPWTPNKVTA